MIGEGTYRKRQAVFGGAGMCQERQLVKCGNLIGKDRLISGECVGKKDYRGRRTPCMSTEYSNSNIETLICKLTTPA